MDFLMNKKGFLLMNWELTKVTIPTCHVLSGKMYK